MELWVTPFVLLVFGRLVVLVFGHLCWFIVYTGLIKGYFLPTLPLRQINAGHNICDKEVHDDCIKSSLICRHHTIYGYRYYEWLCIHTQHAHTNAYAHVMHIHTLVQHATKMSWSKWSTNGFHRWKGKLGFWQKYSRSNSSMIIEEQRYDPLSQCH